MPWFSWLWNKEHSHYIVWDQEIFIMIIISSFESSSIIDVGNKEKQQSKKTELKNLNPNYHFEVILSLPQERKKK